MKRLVTIVFIFTALSNETFSAEFSMSAGSGGIFGYTFTRYTMEGGGARSFQRMDRVDYAGFLFFDATYAEFSIMLQGGKNSYEENMALKSASLGDDNGTGTTASLGFSLTGKYPFSITDSISWFPLLGIEYHTALIEKRKPNGYDSEYSRTDGIEPSDRNKNDNAYPLSAWNSFWIDLGVGLDYSISSPLFIRTELLFGFRLPTNYELGALEVVKKQLNIQDPKLAGLTGNPAMKIAIAYRL